MPALQSKNIPGTIKFSTEAVSCPWCAADEREIAVPNEELICWLDKDQPHPFQFSRCKKCELVYLDPRPANLDEVYLEDYHAHVTKGKTRGKFKQWSRQMLMRLYLGYPPKPNPIVSGILKNIWAGRWKKFQSEHGHMLIPWGGSGKGRLLDVGSGAGDKLLKYREMGWHVCGVESDTKAAETAKKIFDLDVRSGFLEDQKFADGSFDAVTLNFVLEHVPNPKRILLECHRILAEDGVLLVDVPNFDSGVRKAFGGLWTQYGLPEHWLLPTEKTLRMMIEATGFEVESVSHRGSIGLYQVCHRRAKEAGKLDPSFPATDDKASIQQWFAKNCAAPNGELMLLLGRKKS